MYPAGQTVTLLDRLTASDVLDGDISSGIRITSQNVINSQPGVYSVTAQVDSRLGNSVVLPLKVVITAGGPQLITLSDYLVYLPRGSAFDAAGYIQSVTAPDGTALSAGQVSIESPVDTSVPGTYHVGYSVTAQGQSLYRLSGGGGGIKEGSSWMKTIRACNGPISSPSASCGRWRGSCGCCCWRPSPAPWRRGSC